MCRIGNLGRVNLSVIVPFYQKQDHWVKANFFLMPQLIPGDEVLLVDDWSPDGFNFKHAYLRVIRPPKSSSHILRISALRNLGIEEAKNDAILILDPDCLAGPTLLENARALFNREILFGGRIDYFKKDGTISGDPRLYKKWRLGWMIWGGLMLFSKSRTRNIEWFDEAFNGRWGSEDNDFANRCYYNDIVLKYTLRLHVLHQFHDLHRPGYSVNQKIAKKKLLAYKKSVMINHMLIIVDVYGWAWDIASQELKKFIPGVDVKVINVQDLKVLIRKKLFKTSDYDIVLIYPWGYRSIVKKLNPNNTIICVAGGEQLKMKDNFMKTCGQFNVFGACNSKIQRVIQSWLPNKKVVVLSHGVDSDKFKPKPIIHGRFTVGWAGRTERALKRFHLAKQICHRVDVDLKVAGFIGDKDHYDHSSMPLFYNSVDVFLVTSEAEAHPLVVYEAMSCGIPIVSTDVGDVKENIKGCGFILEESDLVRRGVKALSKLKSNKDLRLKMGAAARKNILKNWMWPKITPQYTVLKKYMPGWKLI